MHFKRPFQLAPIYQIKSKVLHYLASVICRNCIMIVIVLTIKHLFWSVVHGPATCHKMRRNLQEKMLNYWIFRHMYEFCESKALYQQ